MIDLRSDTVTQPDAAMRAAMVSAELGDDGLEADPTTARLEARAAELVGHEAALFVPSGTMGNLLATLCQTRPGDEVIVEQSAHVYNFESNGQSAIAGVLPIPVEGPRGHLSAALLAETLDGLVPRGPAPALVWLENTANLAGGTVLDVAGMRAVCELAHARGLKVHLDGARLFNAAVALGVPAAELAGPCDSVMFCLSKGLGCPVGSLLCGGAELITRARALRRQLGGTLRQSGVLSAAGLVALETRIDRLADDHAGAAWLARRLAELPGVEVDLSRVETNMVWFACEDRDWPARCAAAGVRFVALGDGRCRAVTHADVSRAEIEQAAELMAGQLRAGQA